MRRFALTAVLALLGLSLASATPNRVGAEELPSSAVEASVVSVVDGATFRVRIGDAEEDVRLLGIDPLAPGDDARPAECYGSEALRGTRGLLSDGRSVWLEPGEVDRDSSGRLLRYAWIEDADDGDASLVNELVLRRGFAALDPASGDSGYAERLAEAEEEARQSGWGLWRACGEPHAPVGVTPTGIAIPAIGVDASIEAVDIVDGVMGVPAEPWNVGWYPELGALDRGVNVVMAGHINWAGIGDTVFADLAALGEGDAILVSGANDEGVAYRVSAAWTVGADSSGEDLAAVIGPTEGESLTLITCNGDFVGGVYLSRFIVRAERVAPEGVVDDAGDAPNGEARTALEDLNFRVGPSGDDGVLFVIPAGSDVILLTGAAEENGYVAVEFDGVIGWVAAEFLGQDG